MIFLRMIILVTREISCLSSLQALNNFKVEDFLKSQEEISKTSNSGASTLSNV